MGSANDENFHGIRRKSILIIEVSKPDLERGKGMSLREPLYEATLQKMKRLVAIGRFWLTDHARYDRMDLRGVRYRDIRPFFANATHIEKGALSRDPINNEENFVYLVRGTLPDGRGMVIVATLSEYDGAETVKIITVMPDGC